MRPTKLTMSAFGPYKEVATIDFETINDQNIFLISGPTGAGKTTVFDAISFALYGGASGSNREHDGFRSDFADDDDLTYVELEFIFRDERYTVRRVPKQRKKKVRGDGYTEQNTEAQLWFPNGQKPITGVTNVNEAIHTMFGITYDQFKQIVMLPQGEFRKLLDAKSNEREEIFRKIFGTELYNRMQTDLNDRSKALRKQLEQLEQKIKTNLEHTNPGTNERVLALLQKEHINQDELLEEIRFLMLDDLYERRQLEDKIRNNSKDIEAISEAIIKAKELNQRLSKKSELEEELKALNNKVEMIKANELKVALAEKAERLKPLEDHKNQASNTVTTLKEEFKQEQVALEQLQEEFKCAKVNLEETKSQEQREKELTETLPTLKQMIEKFKALDDIQVTIDKLEQSSKDYDQTYNEINSAIKAKENKQNDYTKQLEALELVDDELIRYTTKQNARLSAHERLKSLEKTYDTYQDLTATHTALTKTYETFEAAFKEQRERYEIKEEQFKRGQAGLLAELLEVNSACPVCGSCVHPNKAIKPDSVPTEDELKEAKDRLESKRSERDASYDHVQRIYVQIQEKQGAIRSLLLDLNEKDGLILGDLHSVDFESILKQESKQADKELQSLEEKINECRLKKTKKESLKRDQLDVKLKLEELTIKHNEIDAKRSNINEELNTEKTRFNQIKSDLPEIYETLNDLELDIRQLTDELTRLETKRKEANETYQTLSQLVSSKKGLVEEKERQLREAQKELEKQTQNLMNQIEASSFKTVDEYKKAWLTELEITDYKQDIKEYYETKRSKEDYLKELEHELIKQEKVNFDALVEKKETLENERTALVNQDKIIHTRIETNTGVIKAVEQLLEDEKEINQTFTLISELASLANGKNNERLTFERYVLAAYFDEIIHAANLRLAKMTAGRYVLKRIEERGKGNSQQGLELEVLDHYTGKSRPVKTLSGGESFKASLALALGLADIVQSYAGGISLDTIFIDEGFGSLDPESLDQAIGTLVSLEQSGRLVGVISHVSELKERINAKLLITRDSDGSSKASFNV